MKNLLTILILFISHLGFCQRDSSAAVFISTELDPPEELVVIVGDHILYDTAVSYSLLDKYSSIIMRKKYYTMKKGYRKFKIQSKDGILVCILKPGTKIDFAQMGMTDRIKSK